MKISSYISLCLLVAIILLAQLFNPSIAWMHSEKRPNLRIAMPLQQSANLRIVGPNNEANPVVNENNKLMLTVVDANNKPITSGVSFETDSPDIVSVDAKTGMVTGKLQGYATITARVGSNTTSNFVVVARVNSSKGKKVPGDTKVDTNGAVYFSDPNNHVILKKANSTADAATLAGQTGVKGIKDDIGVNALFNGPIGIAIDNRSGGGIYIADTLNNVIRKIDFNNRVTTVLGSGTIGTMRSTTPFSQAVFNNPQGLAIDAGGNLYIADTGNHAIYIADFVKQEVRPFAGVPGTPGKADGPGSTAMFNRPVSISINAAKATLFNTGSQDIILVADTGNNRIRSITRDGIVSTLGPIRNTLAPKNDDAITANASSSEFEFNAPQSIGIDDLGNIYVVDKSGVRVITRSVNNVSQLVSLAQPDTSFNQAASVVVQGTSTLVLDNNAATDSEAVKVVTVGAPQILSMTRNSDRLEGGSEVMITGANFAPESLVVLGDSVVPDAVVESATKILIPKVPPQSAPGSRTLSIRTRGGVSQRAFIISAKPFSELATKEITTIVGGVPFIGDSGNGLLAGLNSPQGITIDGAGNLYISDSGHNRIRVVDNVGIITTVAGNGSANFSGDNGPALSASLNVPTIILLDNNGNLLIADSRNNVVRRVDINTSIITTIAGNGNNDFSGDNGPATAAALSSPTGICIDKAGNLYIADSGNSRIRKVDAKTGIITTVVGTGFPGFSGDNGLATKARIAFAGGVVVDATGNLFVLDREVNNRIRRVDAKTGIITTVVGNGQFRYNGDNIKATAAAIDPNSMAIDDKGNIFVADLANSRIRRIDAVSNIITTVAGNGTRGFSGDGGAATAAGLAFPADVVIDGFGNLLIADQFNERIRLVNSSTNIITTVAGSNISFGDNGPASNAILSDPFTLAFDKAGNMIVADTEDSLIRKIDATTGVITTIAGTGDAISAGDGGPATSASFIFPSGVVVDSVGNIYIADRFGDRVRRIDPAGMISTFAGSETRSFGGDNGPANKAQLNAPISLAIDKAENIFIADSANGRIRRVDKSGTITTVAGTGSFSANGDGGLATKAGIGFPLSIATDNAGNIIILDGFNLVIRRVDVNSGLISTIAGNGISGFSGDGGPATSASISLSFGICTDTAGNVYLVDSSNNRIRRITPDGLINTVVGDGRADYRGDGGPAISASLNTPKGVLVDADGNIFIAAGFNSAIRVVRAMGSTGGMNTVTINNADFSKPLLNISGKGFGQSGATVSVNNKDISSLIQSQSDTLVTLKGNKKKLNIKKGQNQVVVTIDGVASNTFTFSF